MPNVAGMSSFFPFDTHFKSLWESSAACGNNAPCPGPEGKRERSVTEPPGRGELPLPCPRDLVSLPPGARLSVDMIDPALSRHRPRPNTGDDGLWSEAHSPVEHVDLPADPFMSSRTNSGATPKAMSERPRSEMADVEEARREAAILREKLQQAEEKLANCSAGQNADSPDRYVHDNLSVTAPPIVHRDQLSNTAPPGVQQVGSISSGGRRAPVEVQVETRMPVPAAAGALRHSGSMRTDESCWRVRHVRCDNDKMPTALRAQPSGKEPPLKDATVEPHEEVLVLDSQTDIKDPNTVWTRVSCAKGEGWMKRMHLKEGGWRMRHVRGDNANIPTALRERPTATAKPLQAVRAVAHEEVLVHVQLEVPEGGRPVTWARVACKSGEGWLKREHLKEVLPLGPKVEELPDNASETQSVAAPSSPRSEHAHTYIARTPPLPAPPRTQPWLAVAPQHQCEQQHQVNAFPPTPQPADLAALQCAMQSAMVSLESPMQSKTSTVIAEARCDSCSEYPASGVRIRLGVLDFVSRSVGGTGMFDTVSFRATVQLGGAIDDGPTPRWLDNGPHTEIKTMKFGRSISEDGRYEAKICCQFDEALDLPWPPPSPVPEKIAVDIWMERTTVVDHFDRVLGNLGLHTPAQADRRWLGRAVADLPPEGVDDMPFAWKVEGSGLDQAPVPQTLSIGVEWVYEVLESL